MEQNTEKIFHGLTLLAHCGTGAYGDVYYCRDISGRVLAVKIISKQKLGDHWERELRGVSNYRNVTENAPELLQIYHVEEDAENFFYTMEAADSAGKDAYLPETLALRLKDGPLPQTDVFRVLSGIFNGIKTIHKAGFAHRDIKPDNIIFVKGVPKLGDIGLMASLTNSSTQLAGTLDFLPPEIRTADGSDSISKESPRQNDLYAFGKVVYCVVTGQDSHSWPTIPRGLPLTLPLKFFLRLSFQLCSKDPAKRLVSIEKLEHEFSEIERKLLFGETLSDKCRYIMKTTLCDIQSALTHSLRFGKRYWIILLAAFLCIGAAAWSLWPEPPFDIAQQKTHQYKNPELGVTMTLPFQWDIVANETLNGYAESLPRQDMTEKEKTFWEFYKALLQMGGNLITCGFSDAGFLNNITIQAVKVDSDDLLNKTDEELRLELKQMWQVDLGFNTEIYEIRRMEKAGLPCIFIDLSHEPQKIRINNYVFILPEKSISVALTAAVKDFPGLRAKFESILTTLKIEKIPESAVR